jgi:putative addiction module component (TIGR02574 family)
MHCQYSNVPTVSERRLRYAADLPPRDVDAIFAIGLSGRIQLVKNLSDLLELPPEQRLQLVEVIWDSLVEFPEAVPISDEVREELDRRSSAYYEHPSSARPWSEIREELFGKE